MSFVIVTDSASDTQLETTAREDVFVVPTIVIVDEKEYLDPDLPNHELIEMFENGKMAKTSQPSPDQFERTYNKAKSSNLPIIGIHISSKLSGTFNGASLVTSQMEDIDVKLVDTLNVSFGSGYFVKMATLLKDLGYDRDQVYDVFSKIKEDIHIEVIINNIEHLKHGGRVNLGQYWLLKLLRLRPVITNQEGLLVSHGMSRGGRYGVKKIVKNILKYDEFGDDRIFILGHVTTPDIMKLIKNKIRTEPKKDVWEIVISSTLLSHVGTDSYGIMVAPSIEKLESMISSNSL